MKLHKTSKLTALSIILPSVFLLMQAAHAELPIQQPVELEVVHQLYEGRVDGIASCLSLTRLGTHIEVGLSKKGSTECQAEQSSAFFLSPIGSNGQWQNDQDITLTIRDLQAKPMQETVWLLESMQTSNGNIYLKSRTDNQSGQQISFQLIESRLGYPALPYRVTVVLEASPFSKGEQNRAAPPPSPPVTAIRIYQDKQLIQEIETESPQGYPSVYLPVFEDLNGDGYADISKIASIGTAGEFYEYWVYAPKNKLFIELDEATRDELANAWVDHKNKLIVTGYNSRIAHMSTVDTQRWVDGKLTLVDSASGYFMPVKVEGEILYCEVMSVYDEETGYIIYDPMLIQDESGVLTLLGELPINGDYQTCIESFSDYGSYGATLENTRIAIWHINRSGVEIAKNYHSTDWEHSRGGENRTASNLWCPVIPYYDADKNSIGWFTENRLGSNDETLCLSEKPQ